MQRLKLVLAGILFASSTTIAADDSNNFDVSGFARVVAGYLDESKASYEGYDDSLSLSEQSLLGVQAEYSFNEQLSVAAQLLAHSGDSRDSGVEWLYLRYEPSPNWRFKLGRLRTPIFQYSDILDVGFAYPWITPPQQIYSAYLFSNYEGATATYRQYYSGFNFDFEVFLGMFDETENYAGLIVPVKADPLAGFVFKSRHDAVQLHASYIRTNDFSTVVAEFDQFANILRSAGFQESADSLALKGRVEVMLGGLNYDSVDYFASTEWMRISSDVLLVPKTDSFYVTVGANLAPFQVHFTYASSSAEYDTIENEVPLGINPQLDALHFQYDTFIDNLPLDTLDSATVGVRYDLNSSVALKADVSWLDTKPDERGFFVINDASFDREAVLYQIAVEWVF
ncbi:hypothetical protein QTP81_10275 [Alteromonas sp. ASW11-36]|uniref:Porin n=1 Tax=Alteromonas arenosi TaxID=3055817 RepID=A0ABT7SXR5_9ALTE|nr:hypothetical protein [Alteromonas sp. ASW11-36]MDM7860983.1 hypothetical protein [Alteromonas sp. ASW11-36]